MFHWICPECGQEIAPGVKECPVCEPQTSSPAVPPPALTPVPEVSVRPVSGPPVPVMQPSEPVEQPAPQPKIASQPEIALRPQVILQPHVVPQPQAVKTPDAGKESRQIPLFDVDALMAEAPAVVMPSVQLEVLREAPPQGGLEEAAKPPANETFADRLADLAEHLHAERMPFAMHRVIPGSSSPAPSGAPVVLDVPPSRPLLAPPPRMLLLSEPQPPAMASRIALDCLFQKPQVTHSGPSRQALDAEPAAPGKVRLPGPPERPAAPALAPLQSYFKAADRQMRSATFATKAIADLGISEPKVTLPGPALPRELMSLQAAGLVPLRRTRRPGATPSRYGWTTRFVVLAILLTAGLAAYTVLPGTSASTPSNPTPEPKMEQPVRSDNSNSLARFVEVTGIRFLDMNKKPQIHYLVVNHSNAPLSSVTVYVTLRVSSAKPGQPPLSRFSFRSPSLAAFEAKEMASPIERVTGPLDLPDWQDLRAEVEVQ